MSGASALFDIVVVGGGPAGLSTALNARLEGFSVLVIERDVWGGRAAQSAAIDNVLALPTSGPGFAQTAKAHCAAHGVHFVTGNVTAIVPGLVTCESGEAYASRAIVIATGLQWRELHVPGLREAILAGSARYGCSTEQVKAVEGLTVGVVGGANSAGINALHFTTQGARMVYVLVRSDLGGMSHYLRERLLAHPKAQVVFSGELVGVVDNHLGGLGVQFSRYRNLGRRPLVDEPWDLEVDRLFLFPDATPHTDFVQARKDPRGFLVTTPSMELCAEDTPGVWRNPRVLPGVFAAGDVRQGSIKRIAAAIGDGATVVYHLKHFLEEEVKGCATCAA